ncbi:MAG: shikimate kinase [candidate division Zixibacteria bacterium]
MKNRMIFLAGFSGSGKSTIGPPLARKLGRKFVDLDELIARDAGCSIESIFARKNGEEMFRRLETKAIRKTVENRRKGKIVALGGGAFVSPVNRSLIADFGLSIYLSCSRLEIYRRLSMASDRPLLNVRPKKGQTIRQARIIAIGRLLDRRKKSYRLADVTLSVTNRTVNQCLSEIVRILEKRDADGQS